MSDDNKKLFNEFPPVTTAEWEAKITADLKGADYDKKLVWKTNEGFAVRPYYRAENLESLGYLKQLPGQFPFVRGSKVDTNEWYVRQDIDVKDVAEANKKALDVLNKGVTSLGFCISHKVEINAANIEALLKNICLSAVEINFVCGKRSVELVPVFVDYVKKSGYKAEEIIGSVNLDNVGHLVKRGSFCFGDNATALTKVKGAVEQLKAIPNFKAITVHGSYFTNAGATIVQSLAFSLAMGADYMTWLTEAGVSAADVASKLKFNFAVSSNYFMEIAKFRAARLLWAKIAESYDANVKAVMNIHAETAKFNMAAYDPHTNLLRSTTEAMSAAIGSVDSMTVVPFDVTFENQTDFAERIARNQQIILQEESYFNKIVDPSAGSYYIETLTDSIATEAWKLFLDIQSKGGFVKAFEAGEIQSQVKDAAAKREKAIATRRESLLGVNQFPNFNEVINKDIVDATYGCCKCSSEEKQVAEPLRMFRGAEAFEALRQATDKSGRRPKVFMLTIGAVAMRKARAGFACNFFACAGFEVVDNNGFKTAEEGVKAALEAKADIVVICSSDDEYVTFAPEAFEALGGKAIFVVAGAPACQAELEAKGIKNFISVKSNVLETLKGYQKELKIN
ncbi:MAG: methylmalonyl-CoA mutase small subunit [Bacteroidota bacterium]|nr:methylmalonyl-CoA mutase small subunit [Bacteroidota bacterium]